MPSIDRARIASLLEAEDRQFIAEHPKSRALHARAKGSLLDGVPAPWMTQWASPFPLFIESARGATLRDADGRDYLDLSLGDTGALFGHAPAAVADAVAEQATRGFTFMLPTEDAAWVGEELGRRFGVPLWQFAMTATDANRFAIKIARAVTGRGRIVVFNGCYHGSLDETLVAMRNGVMAPLPENMGPGIDPADTTRMVEFNDVPALERALAGGDVACVLIEPALTNAGLVFPRPGFHESVRELTRAHGTILIADETHTICAGPRGATGIFGLDPDMITLGKPIAGGIPAAAYGFSAAIGEKVSAWAAARDSFVVGVGGTLSGNAFAMHAMRAALERVMTAEAYATMEALAARLADGVRETIAAHGLPWGVARLGARVEYRFHVHEPANATEATAAADPGLDRLFRLYFMNRGILLTIFYNVALLSPMTTDADVDRHNTVFAAFAEALAG